MNNINIIGTMTRDLELKYLPSGTPVGSFAIAVNQDYKKQDGTKVEKTSFFDVKVIGKQSEIINQYFSKGSRIGITGELDQETWQDNQGQNRSKVVIKLEQFSFIDKKSNDNQGQRSQTQNNYQPKQHQQDIPEIDLSIDDDEVPFNRG
jgi:single-strand DNA-binding protein